MAPKFTFLLFGLEKRFNNHFVLEKYAIKVELVYNFMDLFVNSEFVWVFVCDCCSLDV